jgi:hypothetical protein
MWVSPHLAVSFTDLQICNGSITAFGARIIKGFGYTPLESIALLIPGGFVTCVTIYLFTWPVSRTINKRTYVSNGQYIVQS